MTMHYISNKLLRLAEHIDNDAWRGLPELYNDSKLPHGSVESMESNELDGSYCADSCRTQAWSASTILDVLEEMHRINKGQAA